MDNPNIHGPVPTTPLYTIGQKLTAPNGLPVTLESQEWGQASNLWDWEKQQEIVINYWGWILSTRHANGDKGLGFEEYYKPA